MYVFIFRALEVIILLKLKLIKQQQEKNSVCFSIICEK